MPRLLPVSCEKPAVSVEPSKVIDTVPKHVFGTNFEPSVVITDGSSIVVMKLGAFLAKSYEVKDNKVTFSGVTMTCPGIRFIVGFEVRALVGIGPTLLSLVGTDVPFG